MIADALVRVAAGEHLDRASVRAVMTEIMGGDAPDLEVAALLAALRTRGESLDEVVGAAEAMRDLAVPLPDAPAGALDTCGTGGGGVGTFNISTLAALVVASAGVPVAKHGNRAATSRCGSADLLEELGVPLAVPPETMARSVEAVGIGFLFAPACHPAMRHVAPIRRALPIPTLFNRLGPLTHPMRVRRQLVGVADPAMLDSTLDALVELGAESVWVFHSSDARDEISLAEPTQVGVWSRGCRSSLRIDPGQHVKRAPVESLVGGDAAANARIARDVLGGRPGAKRDAVVLTAAAALCVAERADGLGQGVELAERLLDAGVPSELLERWVAFLEGECA